MRFFFTIIFLILFYSCETNSKSKSLSGIALGTPFNIKHDSLIDESDIKTSIDSILKKINKSMSTYDSESDISKINNGFEIQVDSLFLEVFSKASEVWQLTGGAFDPTVGAFVNAYGFGPKQKIINNLSTIQLDSLLNITGWNKIHLNNNGYLIKSNKYIHLDFNAIAKGYSVDLISKYLESVGAKNYLVEIGGEISARGISPNSNKPWKIGIDYPESSLSKRNNFTTHILNNRSIATSGNYRHFRIDKKTGKKYVHTIDPRTGYPIESNILSTSVTAAKCMTADAWATSLMVLSLDDGLALIEKDIDLQAFWIISTENRIEPVYSSGWKK